MCNGINGAFAISLNGSAYLHNDDFRIVVDPHRNDTVAEAAAQDELHVSECMNALIHFREKLKLGRDDAANTGDDYLPAVEVSREY